MKHYALAHTTLDKLVRPRDTGEPVVSHVLRETRERQPDFDAMRRAISGDAVADEQAPPSDRQDR